MRDDEIDMLVRRAADRPVDVGAMQSAVLSRLRGPAAPGIFDWLRGPALAAPACFAVILALTPLAVARVAGGGIEDLIAGAALGDPLLMQPPLLGLFGDGR